MNGYNTYNINLNGLNTIEVDYLNEISSTIITYLKNITSDVQEQLNSINVTEWTKLIKQSSNLIGQNTFISSLFYGNIDMNNNDVLLKGGITQYSSGENTLGQTSFINTINTSNTNQSSGTTTLLDTNLGILTKSANKYITQSSGSNSFLFSNFTNIDVTGNVKTNTFNTS